MIKQKMNIHLIKCWYKVALILGLMSLMACPDPGETGPACMDTNCADYASQAAAQADFLADPECRGDLDADHDGQACEDYFRSSGGGGTGGGGCPTTASCGCSNKRKAECASACCKWVVGDGCKCK